MALIHKIEKVTLQSPKIHGDADCTYTAFTAEDGKKYLQIDTYGSNQRQVKGKKSQTIQVNSESAQMLVELLKSEFTIK